MNNFNSVFATIILYNTRNSAWNPKNLARWYDNYTHICLAVSYVRVCVCVQLCIYCVYVTLFPHNTHCSRKYSRHRSKNFPKKKSKINVTCYRTFPISFNTAEEPFFVVSSQNFSIRQLFPRTGGQTHAYNLRDINHAFWWFHWSERHPHFLICCVCTMTFCFVPTSRPTPTEKPNSFQKVMCSFHTAANGTNKTVLCSRLKCRD